MVTKKLLSYLVAFSLFIAMLSTQVLADSEIINRQFSDVPVHKPYATAVYDLAERNIIGGYPDGTFNPSASITRGQAAAIIAKLLNLPTDNVKKPEFQDVNENLWSYGAIAATVERGIFKGYQNGRFGPNDPITRGQMASILIKTFGFNTYRYQSQATPFTDIDGSMSHRSAIYTLYELNITSGTSPTTFSPNAPITRAQAAVLITNTEKTVSNMVTLKGKDFGWSEVKSYNDYQSDFLREQLEPTIIKILYDSDALQIVPLKTGTQKLVISGAKQRESETEYIKYYVHVQKQNGKLTVDFEETNDILPTLVRLEVTKEKIKDITLTGTDGKTIQSNVSFEICPEDKSDVRTSDIRRICIPIEKPLENAAIVEYESGKKVKFAISSSEVSGSFYYHTHSFPVIPKVTVDLTKHQGNFSEFIISDDGKRIMKVTKDPKADIFHIEGIGEGYAEIDFPKSPFSSGNTLGISISVRKIGNLFNVEASPYTLEDISR